jgi:hypothetical protein
LVWLHRAFYKNTKNFDLWNSLGKYLLIFKKKVQLSFFLSFQRLAIFLDAPKNWFPKKGTIYPTEQRWLFLELAIFQFLFYDSEVSKFSMSGKTYWSEKPDLTLLKNRIDNLPFDNRLLFLLKKKTYNFFKKAIVK